MNVDCTEDVCSCNLFFSFTSTFTLFCSLITIVMNSQQINEESSMNVWWDSRMETSEGNEEVSEEGQGDKSIRRGSYESRRWSERGEHEVVYCKETRWMKWGEVDNGRWGGEERNERNTPSYSFLNAEHEKRRFPPVTIMSRCCKVGFGVLF